MPFVVSADFPDVTPELYVRTHTEVMSDGRPQGMIAHCCAAKDGGISVVDIWESVELFEAFVGGKVAPVLQQHGVEAGPQNLSITELINADAFEYDGTVRSGE